MRTPVSRCSLSALQTETLTQSQYGLQTHLRPSTWQTHPFRDQSVYSSIRPIYQTFVNSMPLAAGNGELPHTAPVRKVRQGIRQRHHLEPISFLSSQYTAWKLTVKVSRYHVVSGTFPLTISLATFAIFLYRVNVPVPPSFNCSGSPYTSATLRIHFADAGPVLSFVRNVTVVPCTRVG